MENRMKRLWMFLVVSGFVTAPVSNGSSADPLTLYKAENIAIAKENVRRYQWAREIVEKWERSAGYAMTCDRAFFESIIEPLTPWPHYGQSCPACVGKQSSMGETSLYNWDVHDPDRITCKYCGTSYPSADYPETGSMTCPRMGQTFTFYLTDEERAHPDDTSGQYAFRWASWPVHTSFSGIIRAKKAGWCIAQILPLAKLYALTGDTGYAEKAALIMDVVASRYPNWLYHSYNGTFADCPPGEAAAEMGRNPRAGKFPVETIITAFPGLHTRDGYATLNNGFWGAGRFGCSGSDGGLILNMAVAWDLIHEARKPDGTSVIDEEMSNRIINSLIIPGCEDSENWDEINNKCGPGRAMSAAVGILLDRPESVRRGIGGFDALMDKSFHFDGFCEESPSYSGMHLNLMRNIPEILLGYSDPPGYRPVSGPRIDNLDPFRDKDRYRLALESMVRMLDFDNRFPVIGDTHYGSGIDAIHAEVLVSHYGDRYAALLEESLGAPLSEKGDEYALWHRPPDTASGNGSGLPKRSEWFPGWHVSVMRGSSPDRTALYYNGYQHGGHRHYDTLGISYLALGREFASDRGYIWDDPRNAWTKSTLSHNIVTVDNMSQDIDDCHSTLDLFGTSPLVEVTEATANAYGQCSLYKRTTALLYLPDGGSYAVDIFRVRGGKSHVYSLNCNGQLIGVTGADPRETGREIKWLDNLRSDTPNSTFSTTWEYDGARFGMIMVSPVDRLTIADAPGWRNNRGEALNAPPIQQVLAERNTDDGYSDFAAVLVPYEGLESPVQAVRTLLYEQGPGNIALKIELDGRTDYIFSFTDTAPREFGPLKAAGRFGFASFDKSGKLTAAYLLAGTELTASGVGVTLDKPSVAITAASADGRTFRLAGSTPDGMDLAGKTLLADGTGYEIESFTKNAITVRDYPAIECGSVTVLNEGLYRARE